MGIANCKKCGALFQKKTSRDICDNCYNEQCKLIDEMTNYVLNDSREHVNAKEVMEKFKISSKDFEILFGQRKLVRMTSKLTINCIACHKEFLAENCSSFICNECALKMKKNVPPPSIDNSYLGY